MKIRKITAPNAKEQNILHRLEEMGRNVIFSDKKVQGADIYREGPVLFVSSPKRFKLYTDGQDILLVRAGSGHFKWKRGETDFYEGDVFEIVQTGEYEVNGSCDFAVYRLEKAEGEIDNG